MANFDVAVGLTQKGLKTTLEAFFKNPTAQSKIFTQNFSQDVGGISVVMKLAIQITPEVVMTPPSATKWQESYNASGTHPVGPPPASNVFQVILSSIKISGTIAGIPVEGTNGLEIYGQFSLVKNVLTVTALSVWLDESGWAKDGITKAIVNAIIIPYGLNTVNKLLNAIPFPQIPKDYTTTEFQDPILGITNSNQLVLATSMKSSPVTDLSNYTPPASEDIYLQVALTLINAVLKEKLGGYKLDESDKKGDSAAYASAEIKATLTSIAGKISNGKTLASLNITGISGYGELGGTATAIAKTVLCPIGTAIDAISDPKNWDKIISNFDIAYTPDPIDIPFTVKVTSTQSVELSIGQVGPIIVIAAPKWSGVIGSALAAMAAGFVDFISVLFATKIVNGLISSHGQNIQVLQNASVQTSVEGITITLTAETGAALVPQGDNLIVEGFTISFS